MSSCDPSASSSETIAACTAHLQAALGGADDVTDADLQNLLAAAVRLYAAKADLRAVAPFGRNADVTTNDVMITVTEMLRSMNVQVFELSMWQTMCGMDGLQPQAD